MNLDIINERRELLNKNLAVNTQNAEKMRAGIVQTEANIQAINGALQECEHWEKEFLAAEAAKGTEIVEEPAMEVVDKN